MKYKNYLFDLYGTLIDLETNEREARTWKKWCKWLDSYNVKHPKYYQFRREFFDLDRAYRKRELEKGNYQVPEIDVMEIYRYLFSKYENRNLSEEFMLEAAYKFRESSMHYIKLFPGVTEYLKKIREEGSRAFILSNAQASYTEPEIKKFGLDKLVDGYMMSSDYWVMKPDKAFYDMIIEKYEMDKAETVMLGDSYQNDYKGALEAGIFAIHLSGENSPNVYYKNQVD